MPPHRSTPARGHRAAAVLRQTAVAILLELDRKDGWAVPKEVAEAIGVATNKLKGTLDRLEEARLIEIEEVGMRAGKITRRVRLTAKGRDVARLLAPVVDRLEAS